MSGGVGGVTGNTRHLDPILIPGRARLAEATHLEVSTG